MDKLKQRIFLRTSPVTMRFSKVLRLHSLVHYVADFLHSKFGANPNQVTTTEGEDVTHDSDAAGTVHFAPAFPGATSVLIKDTVQIKVQMYAYVMGVSKNALVPYLPPSTRLLSSGQLHRCSAAEYAELLLLHALSHGKQVDGAKLLPLL